LRAGADFTQQFQQQVSFTLCDQKTGNHITPSCGLFKFLDQFFMLHFKSRVQGALS
jgi:hypothetical protein